MDVRQSNHMQWSACIHLVSHRHESHRNVDSHIHHTPVSRGQDTRRNETNLIIWLYNLILWFVVEDVGWFVINGMTSHRSAPWQTTIATVMSTLLPLGLVSYMYVNKYRREFYWDWILLPVVVYMWAPFADPFQ